MEDAGDRAQKMRKTGLVRIPLDKIGFCPDNRGGLGISPYHAHEVAWDCLSNKTRISRYVHVDVVEIPEADLQRVRDTNKRKSESEPFMPRYSSTIQYMCLTKTQFVHAQKLGKDGTHTLFGAG